MSKTYDEIAAEMRARVDELAPLVTEHARLTAALGTMDGNPPAPPRRRRGRPRKTDTPTPAPAPVDDAA